MAGVHGNNFGGTSSVQPRMKKKGQMGKVLNYLSWAQG